MSKRSDIAAGTDPLLGEGGCETLAVDMPACERARGSLPADRDVRAISDIFGALGDPTRLRILLALAVEPLCVCDLAEVVAVSASAVSHQLRLLRGLDLVAYRREGKRAVYRLADEHVATLLMQGREHAAERSGV